MNKICTSSAFFTTRAFRHFENFFPNFGISSIAVSQVPMLEKNESQVKYVQCVANFDKSAFFSISTSVSGRSKELSLGKTFYYHSKKFNPIRKFFSPPDS